MKELRSKRIKEILIFFHVIWLEKWKNVGIENLFFWLRRKIRG